MPSRLYVCIRGHSFKDQVPVYDKKGNKTCRICKNARNRKYLQQKPKRVKKYCTTHGESRSAKEYRTWLSLKWRCYNLKEKNYRGRGIIVCDRWVNSYENFLEDMNRAPSPHHSIDRIDVNGNYEPGNCRWATRIEQANNTRRNKLIEYNGQTKTLPQWCRELGLSYDRTYQRIYKYKMSIEDAFYPDIHY